MSLVAFQDDSVGAVAGIIPGACPHIESVTVTVGGVVIPIVAYAAVVRVKACGLVFPCDAVLDGVPPVAGLAAARLESVAIRIFWFAGSVGTVAVAHSPTVLDNDRKFLADKVPTVVAVPPGSTPVKLGRIARSLVMNAESVCVFAVALATVGVVIVVTVAVQEVVSAAASRALFVYEESGALVVVTVDLFQENVLAACDINTYVRIVLHGHIADF